MANETKPAGSGPGVAEPGAGATGIGGQGAGAAGIGGAGTGGQGAGGAGIGGQRAGGAGADAAGIGGQRAGGQGIGGQGAGGQGAGGQGAGGAGTGGQRAGGAGVPNAGPSVRRPVRRGLSFAGIAAVAFACLTAVSWITHSKDSVSIDERVDRVEIDVSSGRVEIVGSPSDETRLDFSVKSGWSRDGGIDHAVSGGVLRVTGGCDSGVFGIWCESDVTITVPASATVTADASAGTLVVSGLSGETSLDSDAGSIEVSDQHGPLTAHSDAGWVRVSGLDAEVAKVTSSAGDVEVEAVSPPRSLDAESSAGSVRVSVPGDIPYDVETDSAVGREVVTVDSLPGARYEIRAFSSAGSVEVVEGR